MVTIITGKINSGKSTKVRKHFQDNLLGDGFVSKKIMIGDKVFGYNILKLSTKQETLFVIRDEFLDEEKEITCQIGPYLFLKETLDYIEDEISFLIENNISPIYLDEVGQLELYDKCFDNILKKILDSNCDLVIAVRDDLLEEVVNKYGIKEYQISEL